MRLSVFLLAPVLALSASAQILDRNFAIQGCVSLTTALNVLSSGGLGLTASYDSEGACRDACAARNFQYAYFNPAPVATTLSCYCSNDPPALSELVSATAAVDGALDTGICGTVNYESIRVNTNFDLRACATADAIAYAGVGQATTVANAGECLTQCVASAYAVLNQNNGLCTCATSARVSGVGSLGACATTENGANLAVYFNDIFPIPSRTLRKRDLQKILGLCPTGLQACLVGDSAVSSDAFECLDTRAELESCGGCINGYADITAGAASVGTDLPGVALGGSTCTLGKCEILACKRGHNLVNGRCLRA